MLKDEEKRVLNEARADNAKLLDDAIEELEKRL